MQLTAVDGRRAFVTLPNDPELVDILAKNGVDISVSEGEAQGNYVSLLGNLLFPLIAFGGLFFLFRYLLPTVVAFRIYQQLLVEGPHVRHGFFSRQVKGTHGSTCVVDTKAC